jgi:hypothetical protein
VSGLSDKPGGLRAHGVIACLVDGLLNLFIVYCSTSIGTGRIQLLNQPLKTGVFKPLKA